MFKHQKASFITALAATACVLISLVFFLISGSTVGYSIANGHWGLIATAVSVLFGAASLLAQSKKAGELAVSLMRLAAGQLPMEGDGWIYCHTGKGSENLSYSDQLLETGLMELTDRFTLKADIGTAGVHETRTYAGQETFVSDGYEIRIRSCLVTPFTAKLEIECMTDTRPEDTANGTGTKLKLKVEVPGTEIWSRNQSLTQSCPVLMEDGRWSTLFALDAQALLVFPEAFRITAGFHDGARFADCSGAVTIRLTDQ